MLLNNCILCFTCPDISSQTFEKDPGWAQLQFWQTFGRPKYPDSQLKLNSTRKIFKYNMSTMFVDRIQMMFINNIIVYCHCMIEFVQIFGFMKITVEHLPAIYWENVPQKNDWKEQEKSAQFQLHFKTYNVLFCHYFCYYRLYQKL